MQTGLQWIEQNTTELAALAQAIWEYAELGLKEEKSAAAQAAFLRKEGFNVQVGVAGMKTGLVASFGEGHPAVGFLGEFDALAGLSQKPIAHKEPVHEGAPGHGCGHNLLGVGSLAAAVALKREMQASGLKGTVRYYGCPAEETSSGKGFMAKYGLFDDLDAALSWHPGSMTMATYRSNLAINAVRFAFHGRTAHAGGAPHMGISALDAVELMNVGVNFLREHVIQEARIHYVISHGGGQPNVVPDFAEVWYYVRAPHRQDMNEIYQRVVKIAEGACLMTGATVEIKFQDGCYEYLPNPVLTDLLEDSLTTVGAPRFNEEEKAFAREIEAGFVPGQKASMLSASHVPPEYWDLTLHEDVAPGFDKGMIAHGSTDVGDVSWIIPTGQLTATTSVMGTAGHSWQNAATCGMSIGHKGMITAARAMAVGGYELMTKPELLQKAKEAFLKQTGGKPYVSPMPADMMEPLPQDM
jgi:aminobenzoyl-glutamate utilization protein B